MSVLCSPFFRLLKVIVVLPVAVVRKRHIPTMEEEVSPPECVRGMISLDRKMFRRDCNIPTLDVSVTLLKQTLKVLKPFYLHIPNVAPVITCDDLYRKKILLKPRYRSLDDFPGNISNQLTDKCKINANDFSSYHLELGYENWTFDKIFKAVLPADANIVSGYSRVGHILHLNLREHLTDYKSLIGQVLLDKHVGIRTVVNKTTNIENTYRNFCMEVIAGEEDFITTVKEHGCSYKMDFSKVYWNPRLDTEHQRVTSLLKVGDVLYDVFAGIGPFAIPAAKKEVTVMANDLNEEAYKWLLGNALLNKVKTLSAFNLDGRDFITSVVKTHILNLLRDASFCGHFRIVMNLPATAVTFLDAFVGLLNGLDVTHISNEKQLPFVDCYTFLKDAHSPEDEIEQLVTKSLKSSAFKGLNIHFVRKVAPNKDMFCVSFQLPKSVLFASGNVIEIVSKKEEHEHNDGEQLTGDIHEEQSSVSPAKKCKLTE